MKLAGAVAMLISGLGTSEAAPDAMRVELRDTLVVSEPGATAAFSIDAAVAEASASGGRVTVVGRGIGATTISVVTPAGIETFSVTVVPPPPWYVPEIDPTATRHFTMWQGGYDSSSARLTNSLEIVNGSYRAYAVNVTRLDAAPSGADARSSMPALSLSWRDRRNEVVLFDELVEHSPLTLDGVTVRGAHVAVGGLELHAGVTSPLLFQGVFLPTEREIVLGASYELRVGRSSFTPSFYAFPSTPQTGGTTGEMGSLLYRYSTADDRLKLRTELGWGGVLGAAADLAYQGEHQRLWISARHQPQGFAALGIGRPIGSMLDAAWTAATPHLTLQVAGTVAHYELGDTHQDVATATTEARAKLSKRVSVSVGASGGRFSGTITPVPIESLTLPVGLYVDGRHAGGYAIYRYQRDSATNRGGHGGRLGGSASWGSLHASGFVDAQQDAATLALALRDEPGLTQALSELGLTAGSPEELAQLLRENATLAQLGYVEGTTLTLSPWRVQAAAEVAWLSQDRSRQQLRLRALVERSQTVTDFEQTRSASLSYARGIGAAVDVTGMVSWWSHGDLAAPQTSWSFAVGARVRIGAVPHLPSWHHDIDGAITDERGAPVQGVTVRLDGGHAVLTDGDGKFAFADVTGPGHRVEAELSDDAYFTSPSRVVVDAGGSAHFAVARAPAHASGHVVDDQGAGIAGISIALRGRTTQTATTDASGAFRFAASPGDYALEPVRDTIPAGYEAVALATRELHLVVGETAHAELVAPANRSIAGTLRDAAATVTLVELGRSATLDAAGRYVFRGLAPGTYTVEASAAGKTTRRTVVVPRGPVVIRGVDLL